MTECSFETAARWLTFHSNRGALKTDVCLRPRLRGDLAAETHVLFNTAVAGSRLALNEV